MTRHCVTTLCVALFMLDVAGVASAADTFNAASYTCTDLYGVARTFNTANLGPNFMAYSLTDSGTITGVGFFANLVAGPAGLNQVVALQCGPAGFGPTSFSGNMSDGYTSLNANYTNNGVPTTGSFYNTGVVYGSALWGSFAGNDSGTLALFGGGLSPYGGYTYTSAGGTAALPPAFSAADNMWVNSSGVVAGGDYDGTGNIGEVYNPGTHTTITMPGAAVHQRRGPGFRNRCWL